MRLTWPLAIACGAVAFALNMHAGRIGFMPLDQSIAFDGAWRMLNGQLPWRDFMTPDGLVPIGLQAAFFAVFGVSWWSYLLHASLINGAAAALVFGYLRAAGLATAPSLSCALATGVWLYPQMGTPFRDQHSLFFSGVAVAGCCHAARSGRHGWWIAAGVAAGLAILSKPIPAFLILPVAGVVLIAAPRRQTVGGLAVTVAASVTTIVVILGGFLAGGSLSSELVEFAWRLPSEIGRERLSGITGHLTPAFNALWTTMPLTSWCGLACLMLTLAALGLHHRRHVHTGDGPSGELLANLAASAGIVFTTIVSCTLTQNSYEMLAGLLPLAAALLMLATLRSLGATPSSRPGTARGLMITAFSLAMLVDAAAGYPAYALTRRGNDMFVTATDRTRPAPPALSHTGFSTWQLPPRYTSATDSFDQLLDWLARHPGNVFLPGDESVVYGLSGRPSVGPLLWDHARLTYRADAAGTRRVTQLLSAAMTRYDVRWVVLPANHGWLAVPDGPYRSFLAAYAGQACEAVGSYRVCENRAAINPGQPTRP
jgi:hypothetical protein